MGIRSLTAISATIFLAVAFSRIVLFSSSWANDIAESNIAIQDIYLADENQSENWPAYGRTHNERRFSPLTDVNSGNVLNLGVEWFLALPNDNGLVSTPLVVDNVLYFVGSMNVVRAVDASKGNILWTFDPDVATSIDGNRHVGWTHSRGITYYEGKVFLATWDGRLISLAADTGKMIWSTRTFSLDKPMYITGAPKAFKGKVLIGNGGTEHGPSRGFVAAYDVDTGEKVWTFFVVPGNPADGFESAAMKMAASTWTGEWWQHGGGGNVWHGYTYDAELDVIYVGTGNGSPWNQKIRSPDGGDNLFLSSIVALDPDSGEYLWHYQTTPGETWDYNSNMDIVLADLEINGELIKAILHAPKNGFFYVLDRKTGELISAEPFVNTTWATHIDLQTGRPVEVEGARYESAAAVIAPASMGAHTWHAMSYNPNTGLAYIPTIHRAHTFTDENYDLSSWRSEDFLGGVGVDVFASDRQPQEYSGSLQAWDPSENKQAWQVPFDTFGAGTLTTAGNLVFQGRSDGDFVAHDARTGEILWTFDAGLGISAPPITYRVEGKQYIALLVGFGGGFAGLGGDMATKLGWTYGTHTRRLITFALDGKVELPRLPAPQFVSPIIDTRIEFDDSLALVGEQQWNIRCFECHGPGVIASGMAPDLRASHIPLNEIAFESVVRNGALLGRGMPAFPNISDTELSGLVQYIRARAQQTAAVTR